MPSYETAYKYPSSTGFPVPNYGAANMWSNTSYAYAEDGNYTAMLDDVGTYQYQSYGSFNFGIPDGANITGMVIKIAGTTDVDFVSVCGFYFYCTSTSQWESGGAGSDYFTDSLTDDVFTYGMGSAPMTGSDVNDTNFKVLIYGGGSSSYATTWIDYVKIKIYYSTLDDINLTRSETISIGESCQVIKDLEIIVAEAIPINGDKLQVYDGIAYIRSLSTNQPIVEYIPHMELSWRFRLNGGTPDGKTLRLGN